MQLKNLKIGTQLRVTLGLLLVLLLAAGGLSGWQVNRLWQNTERLYHNSLGVRRAIGDLRASALTVRIEFSNFILAPDEEERNRARLNAAAAAADIERQFAILYGRYRGASSDLDEARESYARWWAAQAEIYQWVLAERRDEALRRSDDTGDIGRLRGQFLDRLVAINRTSFRLTDEAFLDAEAQRDAQYRTTLVLGVAALLFSLAAIWLLLKHILGPLRALSGTVDAFRRGEHSVRCGYVSANEFGVLSAAFNEMVTTLETQEQINDQAAQLAGVMLRESEAHTFCLEVLKALIEHTGSQVGAIYLLNEAKTDFECFESIGLTAGRGTAFSAATREGEFGLALATGRLQRVTEIPADTPFTFAAVSGTYRPREILTLPLAAGGETVAVISLASVRGYTPEALRLLEVVAGTTAARTNGVLAYRQIRQLAERLETQNTELSAQQQELAAQSEELRQQTEELQEQNVELERQRLAVEEASRLKSAFLSNMSHELRTPLNSILALSRVLTMQARPKLSDEEAGYLEIIERNGKNLLALINDILDLAKVEAGRLDLHPRPFSLAHTIENLTESLTPLAAQKSLELVADIPADLPPLESDETRVTQILQNLLANALKFTDAGRVTVAAHTDGPNVSVRITDTGIGIPEEALDYIFEEFRQVDGSTARRHEGTGLGLAITRKMLQLLGGDIAVTSAVGAGSTFTVTLPLAWPAAAPAAESGSPERPPESGATNAPARPIETETGPAAPRRILLVEDNEAAVIQVKAVLEGARYRVTVARDGQAACDSIAHAIPDGIVLDLMMPGMDGFAVLGRMRSTPATATIPVLILTAKDLTPGDLQRIHANHVQQLVQKGDVDHDILLSKVAALFTPAPAPAAGPPRILVVEDNPDNLATAKAVLQDRYRMLEATDGEAGLRLAAEARPDLILLDMALPKLDGFAVVRALKRDAALRHIPVIALTAQVMKGDREKILAAGCDDYLPKPLDPEALRKTVADWLNRTARFYAHDSGD